MNHDAFRTTLVGHTVHCLVTQAHWHEGRLSDRFNVLFALVDGRWLRFFIDAGVFFCSVVPSPDPPSASDGHQYWLSEHPFTGTVKEVVFTSSSDSANLQVVLSGGGALSLHNEEDHTVVTFLLPNSASY